MPSKLYQGAVESLSKPEQIALSGFEAWLGAYELDPPAGLFFRGNRVLANIRDESHLVASGSFGDCAGLSSFLKDCAAFHDSLPGQPHTAYIRSCEKHQAEGLPIPREHLPDRLLRYTTNYYSMMKRLLTEVDLEELNEGRLSPEDAFLQIREDWDPGMLTDEHRLGGGEVVFATFTPPEGAPRDDAVALSKALALPHVWQRARTDEEFLVEVTYPTDSVGGFRFPTVADAEWCHLFRPSPEHEPSAERPETRCGWTEPLDGQVAQPEIVHDNQAWTVMDHAPRLVGRIPLAK